MINVIRINLTISVNALSAYQWLRFVYHGGYPKFLRLTLFHILVIEHAIFDDLEDGYGLNHEYMSHEEVYNSTVKKVADAAPKLKALQQKLNPGGKDIWP